MNRLRNTFNKKPPVSNGITSGQDENTRPVSAADHASQHSSYAGSRASSSMSIKKKEEPNEYKLSVVNDSGVYLPDISARSPIRQNSATTPRQSLDSKLIGPSRSSTNSRRVEPPSSTDEEGFEEVGLNGGLDEHAVEGPHDGIKQPPKKKGIFSRFGDNSESSASGDAPRPSSSHRGFHLPGRKRGQSGQGAELGTIEQSATKGEADGVIR
ncbi:MAG: hypothetical protein Q9163_000756 [Psora crenata]